MTEPLGVDVDNFPIDTPEPLQNFVIVFVLNAFFASKRRNFDESRSFFHFHASHL